MISEGESIGRIARCRREGCGCGDLGPCRVADDEIAG
jgi:hypothetical protein